ncbi:LON peptidase substrate-binding domain-containing protein [Spongiibacter taiwanensis]|uniref:LON peptidase substrate-binding domain-containing protein n=1 Tax=Spongiibacter taiwanensis TaxID=1748242 RepID=UPI002034BAD8|nr:LON peptidase substrate-binding domain-containing protein [Spongiibacter taiwanensis]USA44379.1 LON peptidase substrate-binding domain-containing protein [Spongiibacter taiwanensis]
MSLYPLFPLRSVLFPGGRMALRIFERRYLDLVRNSLRQQQSFGIAWLEQGGSEVLEDGASLPELGEVGTEANIVDWNQQPDGLLGIVIEGGRRFRIGSLSQDAGGVYMAEVEWLADEPIAPLPERSQELQRLLQQLGEHPHIQRLGMSLEVDDAGLLANRLAQMLPIDPYVAQQLLAIDDPVVRLNALQEALDHMAR